MDNFLGNDGSEVDGQVPEVFYSFHIVQGPSGSQRISPFMSSVGPCSSITLMHAGTLLVHNKSHKSTSTSHDKSAIPGVRQEELEIDFLINCTQYLAIPCFFINSNGL